MMFREWLQIYGRICADLNIDPFYDWVSSHILYSTIGKNSRISLLDQFRGGTFYVVGNGPELAEALDSIGEGRIIVADSALGAFMKKFPAPDIVVTDLDGRLEDLERAYSLGSLMAIHAHGDNMKQIRSLSGRFASRAIGTTQNYPLDNIFNFYGFTDGDRGAYLAHFLGAETIKLIGFNFLEPSPKERFDAGRKRKKLFWARVLLEKLARTRGSRLGDGPVIPL